jgi:carboxymethylenebutenolidase
MRLQTGQEALVARALTKEGKIGYGFSFRLDAAEARHMAEWHAGVRKLRPHCEPALGHPWETAWVSGEAIDWNVEPGFAKMRWLPEEETMGKMISYNRPDGKSVRGYLAEPKAGSKAPGMVVIQEWWGLNEQIKGVAERLAKSGYRALVPDLYRGKVALEANEAEHLMSSLNFGDAAGQDVRGAVQFLKASGSGKAGVTGFCMGGALTLLAAVNVPEADAAVVWYGYPPLEYVDATKIRAPLLGHFATRDVPFPIAKVDELEKKLRAASVKFEFHRYDAKHAFANETADEKKLDMLEYSPKAAELAWRRTLEFLDRLLKSS